MKPLKYGMLFVMAALMFVSCKKDKDTQTEEKTNEIENLHLIKTLSGEGYSVELFTQSGNLIVGYNKVYLRVKDANGDFVQNASIDWMPMMTMDMGGMIHEHGCPFSEVKKTQGKQTLYEGYIIFSMASDEPHGYWELGMNLPVESNNVHLSDKVNVISTESQYHKIYTSAMGSDGVNYMLALIEPSAPKTGINDIVVGLFKVGENHDFPMVDNYTIRIDPRMPGMGNHSATGNEDMTQRSDGLYGGKVGFSMSGYWKINMILEDSSGNIVKGEEVTGQNLESSLNFKLEF